jgi:hypothetical protein
VGAGGHDDLVALLFGEAVVGEHAALVLGPVARLARRRGSTRFFWISSSVARSARSSSVGCSPCPASPASLGEVRHFGQRVLDAELAALLARRGLAALERLGGAALKLGAMSSSRPSIEAISSTRRRRLPRGW